MQHYAALARRVVSWNHLSPRIDRNDFKAMIEHGLTVAGTKQRVLADPAMELLFRASRGIPRVAANLLRSALVIASHRDQSFVDETVMHDAIVALSLRSAPPATACVFTSARSSGTTSAPGCGTSCAPSIATGEAVDTGSSVTGEANSASSNPRAR